MIVKINGKEKTMEELERAEKLIKEAHDILWRLPSEISLEISNGNHETTGSAQDNLKHMDDEDKKILAEKADSMDYMNRKWKKKPEIEPKA